VLQILRNRSFRNIWVASLLSTFGSQVSRIGLVLYVFDTGEAIISLALLVLFDTLPGAIAAPLAGAVVDGLNKRGVMVVSDLSRMIFMLVILLRPSLSVIYLMTALHSIATVFFQPAKSAAIPLIVKQEDLTRANAVEQSAANLILISGPVIGAVLLRQFGLTTSLLIDATSFLMSALIVARVTIRQVERQKVELSATGALNEIKEGCRYLLRHPLALHLTLLLFVALICTSLWIPLAPFFIRDHLGVSEQLLGWQLGLFGFGAAIGGLIAPRLVDRFGTGVTLFAAFLGEALTLMLYGIVSRVGISMAVVFIWGVILSIIVVPFYSILQKVVEEQFLGRVFSLIKQGENLAIVLAMVGAVLLQDFVTTPLIFLFAGLIYFAFTAVSSFSRGGRALLATR
jgi:DHA3 family macrolide efflux protein-like MFS transporter